MRSLVVCPSSLIGHSSAAAFDFYQSVVLVLSGIIILITIFIILFMAFQKILLNKNFKIQNMKKGSFVVPFRVNIGASIVRISREGKKL